MSRCARRTCRGEAAAAVSDTTETVCPVTEDVPMCRYTNHIPGCDCGCGCQSNCQILAALEEQNRLLTELLGAVTSLTAACLCRCRER